MAKNTKFWKTHLAKSDDKKYAAATGEDPLEEGLKDLTWFENSRRAVKRGLHKTYETFGEEVGNSITTGVPALYLLGLLPFASINTYLTAAAKPGATTCIDSYVRYRHFGVHHHAVPGTSFRDHLSLHEARHTAQARHEQDQPLGRLFRDPRRIHTHLHPLHGYSIRRSPLGS